MNNPPKVSVIIPTCNARDSVKRSVLSALHQDYENLEVTVVDDNPSDLTPMLTSMLNFDSRVKVVRNSADHGPSQARNFGVSHASGDLVTFLDDDDCFLPGRLRSLVEFYQGSGDKYSFISSGRFAEVEDFSEIQSIPGQQFGVISLENIKFGNSIDIGVLMEKSFFEQVGGFDEKLSSLEDWDLFIRALKVKDAYKIKRLDYVVNCTKGRERVSERETSGYFDIAAKYANEFGDRWAWVPKAKGLSIAGRLSFFEAIRYCVRSSNIRPLKMFLSSAFPRSIKFAKMVFAK